MHVISHVVTYYYKSFNFANFTNWKALAKLKLADIYLDSYCFGRVFGVQYLGECHYSDYIVIESILSYILSQ